VAADGLAITPYRLETYHVAQTLDVSSFVAPFRLVE
jgi:hypothetical protein